MTGPSTRQISPNQTGLTYAGVGSRSTPLETLTLMTVLAAELGRRGWVLRSGGANGADSAFEAGAPAHLREIYLPWPGFKSNPSPLCIPPEVAFEIAERYHPAWSRLDDKGRPLMARNTQQVLGENCDDPANLLICYTVDGLARGGTSQALRLAAAYRVPVINLGGAKWRGAGVERVLRVVDGLVARWGEKLLG